MSDDVRLLSQDVFTHTLWHDPVAPSQVVEGVPTEGETTLAEVGEDTGVGLWEMTAGTTRDTEVDEVFVVLSGRGTVAFEDGTVLELAPGTAVRLRAGERTTWTVTETLRKIWVA